MTNTDRIDAPGKSLGKPFVEIYHMLRDAEDDAARWKERALKAEAALSSNVAFGEGVKACVATVEKMLVNADKMAATFAGRPASDTSRVMYESIALELRCVLEAFEDIAPPRAAAPPPPAGGKEG